MIKIIKNPDMHEFKCNCGCIFTYEAEDVGYEDTGYYEPEFNFTIKCPYCNYTWALNYGLTDKEKEKVAKRLNISYKKES